jgi:hypothetical protein
VQVRGSWLEVRSTAPGVLEPLGYHVKKPPRGAETNERVFSVVVDEGDGKTRSLPMLYHGPAQIFADRHMENLGLRLNQALEAIAAVQENEAIYMINACRIGERYGLYSRDLFNRASFRVHMSRLGVEFAEDPYVRLQPSGRFDCRDWGEFDPEFMVSGGPFPQDPEEVENRRGGLAPLMFGVLRMGRITASELKTLASFVRRSHVLSSQSPRALVEQLAAG